MNEFLFVSDPYLLFLFKFFLDNTFSYLLFLFNLDKTYLYLHELFNIHTHIALFVSTGLGSY